MRITVEMDGGFAYFPGLNKPFHVDTAKMDRNQASKIESMIRDARFFEQPSRVGAPAPGAADYRTYTITVNDGLKSHVVKVSDTDENPSLRILIDYLQTLAH